MASTTSLYNKDDLKNKINFQSIYMGNIFRDAQKIKQIEDGRILILYRELFEIIDIKTKKHICKVTLKLEEKSGTRYYDNMFEDFIGLKNKDLVLWSSGKIFYYNKIGNNYKLCQIINELKQQKNRTKICQIGYVEIYNLYNVIELDNNTLLSCNSIGIKLYNYNNKEYKFIKVIRMFLDVKNMVQIKDNNYLVIHHYTYHSGGCFPESYHKFALSLFDLNSNKITDKIFNLETEVDYGYRKNYRFNYFLIGDYFVYQVCDFPYILGDNNHFDWRYKNKKYALSLDFNIYNIKTKKNEMNLKTSFCLLSHFKDNSIFAQNYESLNICCFENNKFIPIYKFNFNNSNLCLLKNNDLIVFGEKKIFREDEIEDITASYFTNTIYCYIHYQHLSK